ncbi:MAG: MlaC/ttg2D family ABC transporter substrate-binding protein, partial [Myxococcota bacterium]
MMRLRTAFLGPLAFALAVTLAPAAYAGPAQDHIRTKHASLTAELKKPASRAREQAVKAHLDGFFDFHKLTKDALAKHYDDLSETEYNELKELVQALVTKNYQKNIEKTLNYQVTFLGDDPMGNDGRRKVRTKVQKRGSDEAPVEVNYALHKVGDDWVVYDIETDGSSMLRNYRNQFGKV